MRSNQAECRLLGVCPEWPMWEVISQINDPIPGNMSGALLLHKWADKGSKVVCCLGTNVVWLLRHTQQMEWVTGASGGHVTVVILQQT